jgi:hypothetical protein
VPRREFRLAKFPPGTSGEVLSIVTTAAQTFIKGAAVILTANKVSESGATPVNLLGVALQSAFTNPGNQLPNSNVLAAGSPIGGRPTECSVAIANRTNIFSGRMVNGGTDPVTPAQTDLGASYGLIKTADGTWAVDQSNVTQLAVKIVGIEPLGTTAVVPIVYFQFINVSFLSN